MASSAAWSSLETSTVSPLPAPRVMISSAELASTGSSPGMPIVTSESSSPAASEMIAAGRAWRPTAEPTTTGLGGMGSPSGWVERVSDGGDVDVDRPDRLVDDHRDCPDDVTDGQGDQV